MLACVALFNLSAASIALAQTTAKLPVGMSFVARGAGGPWGLYRVAAGGGIERIPTEQEPRQACVTPDGSQAVYAAADATVRLRSDGRETIVLRADPKRAYTQPCMSRDGGEVHVVEMADGKSVETEILRLRAGDTGGVPVARQPGAQHDPFVYDKRWLVYASVGCSYGCEELLVEIWARDLVAGKARQLTLLNALSQNPVTDGRRVVFSSNASGTHQLWQVGWDGAGLRRLTEGPRQAVQPALCSGTVHFVRAGPDGAVIARLDDDGRITELPVPGLTSFRALRCL
ncbi:MAG TPA: hypothetical protein VFP68_15935 [Burkholderiaceae bacterium]|nr:hypothetical protein [Burkholderiaceae bacterium]